MNYFMFIVDSPPLINAAQRLVAQALGRLPLFNNHFNRKFEMQFKRFFAEPWPSRLQPRVGPLHLSKIFTF
jgi:hypothetical protein